MRNVFYTSYSKGPEFECQQGLSFFIRILPQSIPLLLPLEFIIYIILCHIIRDIKLNGSQINKTQAIPPRDSYAHSVTVSISTWGRAQPDRGYQCPLRGRRSIDGRPWSAHGLSDRSSLLRAVRVVVVFVWVCLPACLPSVTICQRYDRQ
jgi:hypothetical protein